MKEREKGSTAAGMICVPLKEPVVQVSNVALIAYDVFERARSVFGG